MDQRSPQDSVVDAKKYMEESEAKGIYRPAPAALSEVLFETQLTQIQETISLWWQKFKEPQPLEPRTVVILGTVYENERLESAVVSAAVELKVWCTYRRGFEPIKRAADGPAPLAFMTSVIFNGVSAKSFFSAIDNQAFHTDVGWGCMIRTSQSLLANTFLRLVETGSLKEQHLKGNEPETDRTQKIRDLLKPYGVSPIELREIIRLFGDNYESPFSLHNFVKAASHLPLEVKPGQWFGPSAASLSIKRLCNNYASTSLPLLRVHVSENSDLCNEDMAALFAASSDAVLVLFPVRLGIESVNLYYYPSIFELFALPQSVGIAGGKPSSSYYFVGYSGTDLLYLDPHNLQMVSEEVDLYRTTRCQTLPVSSLDPLMLVGILLLSMDDYICFKAALEKTNKIISFHDLPVKTSIAGEDYIRIKSQLANGLGDYVDVSDQLSGENLLLEESGTEVEVPIESQDHSLDKFDIVERPD